MRVARAMAAPIAVDIDTRRSPCIGPEAQPIGIGRAACRQGTGQSVQRGGFGIEIDILQQDDIGARRCDHGNGCGDLRILATPQITQQKPRPGAAELGVETGKPQNLGPGGLRENRNHYGQGQDQAGCAPSILIPAVNLARCTRIIAAIRAIASARMNKLSGRNIQSAIPQTKPCEEVRIRIPR